MSKKTNLREFLDGLEDGDNDRRILEITIRFAPPDDDVDGDEPEDEDLEESDSDLDDDDDA